MSKKFLKLSLILLLPIFLVSTLAFISSCSSNTNTEPPITEEPSPTPPPPVDQDSIKRKFNIPYLENIVQTNDFGYNPDSFHKTILKYQKDNNQDFLNNIFIDKKISNWKSIQNLEILADDLNGSVSLSFEYGGTHTYNIDLDSKHGLLADSYYYEKMDDLTFAYRISYSSIVSDRLFPVIDANGNSIKNNEGLARAGFIDKTVNGQTAKEKGTWLVDEKQYVKDFTTTGTGWLVDYLPSNDPNQDFYEFIIATNIHVSDLSGAFYFYNDNSFRPNISNGVALDPIYIKTSWAKHNAQLDYNQPNSFSNDNFISDYNTFKNLSFQDEKYSIGDRNKIFEKDVIKNINRLNMNDEDAFSSWNHPMNNAIKQKESLLKDISFYEPEYTATFNYNESSLSQYWKDQLKNNNLSIEYNNIQPDLSFVKAHFSKEDLKNKWPKLLKAIEDQKMDKYLLPLKTVVMEPENDISYYYAGNPYYTGDNPSSSIDGRREAYNGFNYKNDAIGSYYRSGKVFPHIFDINGNEQKFEVWPNNVDIDYVNPTISGSVVGSPVLRYKGEEGHPEDDQFDIYWKNSSVLKKWAPYNQDKVNQTTLKSAFVDTESDWLNSKIKRKPNELPEYNTEYFANSLNRGMIKSTINATKKYYWGSSEFIMGGNSGSIVISPKLEIGGIISSRKSGPDVNLVKQVLIESVVNIATNIKSGEKIIANGIKSRLMELNIYSILYNRK